VASEQEYAYRTNDMLPQVLNMRRVAPEAVLVYGSSMEDTVSLAKNMEDIGWNAPLVGGITLASFAAPAAKQVGPAVFERSAATTYVGFTTCSNDALGQSPYAQLLGRIKAFAPDQFDKLSRSVMAFAYDAVLVAKAGIEGAGTTDAAKVSAWLEQNVAKVPAVTGPLSATKTRHLLHTSKSLIAISRPHELKSDETYKRAGC
jgi:ABC-type branched-subunit amino acid transport system substrate-binding protein